MGAGQNNRSEPPVMCCPSYCFRKGRERGSAGYIPECCGRTSRLGRFSNQRTLVVLRGESKVEKGRKSAIIGFGGMGQRHYAVYQRLGVEVAAICEWYPEKVLKI